MNKLMTKRDWQNLANSGIDFMVDSIGLENTLVNLLKGGLTEHNLIELGFELADIEEAKKFYKQWEAK